jgi:hypothetical protein
LFGHSKVLLFWPGGGPECVCSKSIFDCFAVFADWCQLASPSFPRSVGKPVRGLNEPRHLDRGRGFLPKINDLPFPCLRSFSSFLFARCVDLCGPVARCLLVDLAGAAAPALFGEVRT